MKWTWQTGANEFWDVTYDTPDEALKAMEKRVGHEGYERLYAAGFKLVCVEVVIKPLWVLEAAPKR